MDQNNLDNLIAYLEEHEISQDVIDSIVEMANKSKKTYPQVEKTTLQEDVIIRSRIDNEPDWRIRARLAAQLISNHL